MSAPVTPRASTPARGALNPVFTPRSRLPPALERRRVAQAASPASDRGFAEELVFSPLCILTPPPRNQNPAYLSPNSASSTPASHGLPALAFSPGSSRSVAVSSSTGSW